MTKEEAIKIIRSCNLDDDTMEVLTAAIPELRESEDERIRKDLLEYLKLRLIFPLTDKQTELINKSITWLEKQGEQKPTDTPKFKVGDWIVKDNPCKIIRIDGNYIVQYCDDEKTREISRKYCEFQFHPWTIQDARDGDVLAWDDSNCIAIFSKIENDESFISHGFIGNITGVFEKGYGGHSITNHLHPAAKEQRDILFQKMKEAGYEWDAETKELRKIEPKPTWSEEDGRMLNRLTEYIEWGIGLFFDENECNKAQDWLKSIKERVQSQQELSDNVAVNEYIDLGLPSGTLWKLFSEDGYYTYDEAVEKFSNQLPSKEQWEELKNECNWKWKDNGYNITGPNGKSIFLPADGHCYDSEVYFVGTDGYYWSNTYYNKLNVWYITFNAERIYMTTNYRGISQSVRLIK